MTEPSLTLYKLMILYMLDRVDFPLSGSQLGEFVISRGYTGYFHFQQALNELEEDSFISGEPLRNSTNYSLTETGKEALTLFSSGIPGKIKEDILDYFGDQKLTLRREHDITADYDIRPNGEYIVRTVIKDRGDPLLSMEINVVTKEQAAAICDQWKEKSEIVYQYIIDTLL